MNAPSYDASLFAAVDRHMSSSAGVDDVVMLTIGRDEGGTELAEYTVEVCVEDGGVSYAHAIERAALGGDGVRRTLMLVPPIEWTLTDAETQEAVERAACAADEERERRAEERAEARADRRGEW